MFQRVKAPVNLGRVKVACAPSGKLYRGNAFGPDPFRVQVRLYITLKDADADFIFQGLDGLLQQRSFTRAGRADEIYRKNPLIIKVLLVTDGSVFIGLEKTLVHIYCSGFMAMSMALLMITSTCVTHI